MGGGRDRSPNQPGSFSIRHSGLGPDVSVQGSLPGHPHGPSCPSGSHHPRAGGLWGSPAASKLQEKQPPIPGLALSCLPNPSHMVSISLGSAGACWALSELTFPCLSMQLLARAARPSPRPWSSPALPVRTRLSQPRGGCGEAGAGSCLCSALKLQPGPASHRSLPGEVPAPACLLFPRLCHRSALHPDGIHPWGSAGDSPKTGLFHPKVLHITTGARFGLGAMERDGIQPAPLIPWLLLSPCAGFLDLSGLS